MGVFEILQLVVLVSVPVGGGALGLLVYRIRALGTSIDDFDGRVDALGERVAALEAQQGIVKEVRDDVRDVHRRVDDVLANTSTLEGQMREISGQISVIHEHLLDRRQ